MWWDDGVEGRPERVPMTGSTRPPFGGNARPSGPARSAARAILHRVAVCSPEGLAFPDLPAELPQWVAVDRARTPEEFEGLLPMARLGLLRIRDLGEADVDRMNGVAERCPLTPVFLVLDLTPGNADRRNRLRHGIRGLWPTDVARLPGLVREEVTRSLLEPFGSCTPRSRIGSLTPSTGSGSCACWNARRGVAGVNTSLRNWPRICVSHHQRCAVSPSAASVANLPSAWRRQREPSRASANGPRRCSDRSSDEQHPSEAATPCPRLLLANISIAAHRWLPWIATM